MVFSKEDSESLRDSCNKVRGHTSQIKALLTNLPGEPVCPVENALQSTAEAIEGSKKKELEDGEVDSNVVFDQKTVIDWGNYGFVD